MKHQRREKEFVTLAFVHLRGQLCQSKEYKKKSLLVGRSVCLSVCLHCLSVHLSLLKMSTYLEVLTVNTSFSICLF